MNLFSKILIAALLTLPNFAFADKVLIAVNHIYSPKGFDSNDNAEFVLSGNLPSPCYKFPHADVQIAGKMVFITVTALVGSAKEPDLCPQVLVPYLEPVSLGQLREGNYTVVVNGNTMFEIKGSISIGKATSTQIDNYIYAPVEYVERRSAARAVTLKGYLPSDCFQLERVEFVSNGVDTYSVLPILVQVRELCPMRIIPFEQTIPVPAQLKAEKVLLHIRSMNGKSVNSLFVNR